MHVQYASAQVLWDWKKRLAAPGEPLCEKEVDSVATSLKKFMEGNTIENNNGPGHRHRTRSRSPGCPMPSS